jgi:hypothetical protein
VSDAALDRDPDTLQLCEEFQQVPQRNAADRLRANPN